MNGLSSSLMGKYEKLARIVGLLATNEGRTVSDIDGVSFYRHSESLDAQPCVQPFGMVLAVQGSKEIDFSGQKLAYCVGDVLFAGADLSGFSSVSDCSPQKPFLGITVEFDWETLLSAAEEVRLPPTGAGQRQVFSIVRADEGFLDCILRLLSAGETPELKRALVRIAKEETALRLFHAEPALAGMLKDHSATGKIVRAMVWMKQHFAEDIDMEVLARRFHMSPSSFRSRFRETAGISPLQYQKQLRLQKARLLIVSEHLSASQAAEKVGYESVSQFSREYKRYFGKTALADKSAAGKKTTDVCPTDFEQ